MRLDPSGVAFRVRTRVSLWPEQRKERVASALDLVQPDPERRARRAAQRWLEVTVPRLAPPRRALVAGTFVPPASWAGRAEILVGRSWSPGTAFVGPLDPALIGTRSHDTVALGLSGLDVIGDLSADGTGDVSGVISTAGRIVTESGCLLVWVTAEDGSAPRAVAAAERVGAELGLGVEVTSDAAGAGIVVGGAG